MNLVICRYNKNHKMKSSRLLIHEGTCPDRSSKILRMCPYNPVHKISPENYENHKKVCDQRPIVDETLEKELRDYLMNKDNTNSLSHSTMDSKLLNKKVNQTQNESKINVELDFTTNKKKSLNENRNYSAYANNECKNQPIGIRKTQNENKTANKEKKRKQKEMMNLIGNSNFEESGILDTNISLKNKMNNNKISNNPFDDMYEFDDSITQQNWVYPDSMVRSINELVDTEKEDAELFGYDPNAEDSCIDKKNKNNIEINAVEEYDPEISDFSMTGYSMLTKNLNNN
jgi:hypothetical protein